MTNLRETIEIMRNIRWTMDNVHRDLEHLHLSIVNYQFDTELWETLNLNSQFKMRQLIVQYGSAIHQNQNLIAQYELFYVFWFNLTDMYMRETTQWVENHIEFLDEHILMCVTMMGLFNDELTRLYRLLPVE